MHHSTTHRRVIPRFLHHRGHGSPVVWIESPHEHHAQGSTAGLERWRATSFSDPWPDRA